MDTNKMREQFEVWAAKNYVVPPGIGHLFVRAEIGDGYRLSNINHAWRGWQASREAVVVDLPPKISAHNTTESGFVRPEAEHYDEAIDDCREAIEAQGLKVEVQP
ncbi:hypothetical protein [Pseudomonas sp. NBRC 111132]|uniref:hypothetical protein n=1 Tax=Pseudomonas sp. NBRC 111132 TaxID=1661047 RepID=UPI000761905F|nr:hypothetical protein [Pseudomonas sp. NBRC 111132]